MRCVSESEYVGPRQVAWVDLMGKGQCGSMWCMAKHLRAGSGWAPKREVNVSE